MRATLRAASRKDDSSGGRPDRCEETAACETAERTKWREGQGQRRWERLDEAAPDAMRCPCIHVGDANRRD